MSDSTDEAVANASRRQLQLGHDILLGVCLGLVVVSVASVWFTTGLPSVLGAVSAAVAAFMAGQIAAVEVGQ